MLPNGFYRGAHGRACGEPVINEDHDATDDRRKWPVSTVKTLATLELPALDFSNTVDGVARHAQRLDNLVIDDAHTTAGDRSHRKLRLSWRAKLAHDEDVEWRPQSCSDLYADGQTAPWKGQHDDVRSVGVRL